MVETTPGEFRYGDDQTIHRTGHLDVEVDASGRVVAVWFRCSLVPFEQHDVGPDRAQEMLRVNALPAVKAIVFASDVNG